MRRHALCLLLFFSLFVTGCSHGASQELDNVIAASEASVDSPDFLKIRDSVPIMDPGMPSYVAGEEYDCGVVSSYYQLPATGHIRNGSGLFLVCSDDVEMNQGSHYDAVCVNADGYRLLQRSFFMREFVIREQCLPLAFEYAQFQDEFVITYISADMNQHRIYTDVKVDDNVLVLFDLLLDGCEVSYPILLNPVTGEFVDFLSEIPLDQFPNGSINAFSIMDESRLLVRLNGGEFYYYDTPHAKIYDISALLGYVPESCSAVPGGIVCYGQDNDFDLLCIDTLEVSDISLDVSTIEFFCGLTTSCNQTYVLYRDAENQLHYFDLLSMSGDVLYEPDDWRVNGELLYPSYDGRKVFQYRRNAQGQMEVLIFDCDLQQMILLTLDNSNPVYENRIYWIRDGSLVIGAEELQQYFVYQWKEQEADMIQTEEKIIFQPQDADFVRVKDYIPDLAVEMKYAYPDNFTGHAIYEFEEAWLRYGTVKKLMAVQNVLRPMGLGLKLWDGFRPVAAQFKLWEILPDDTYVANPNIGFSSHSRGNTVDITLVDLSTGAEIPMPTGFDDFSTLADRDYSDCPDHLASNAVLLEDIMQENGFVGYFGEWWHFADSVKYDVERCFDPGLISTWYAQCNEFISLRSAPSTDSLVLDRIPVRETCTLLGYRGEFAYVDFRGQRGYVLSAYLKKQ